MSRTLNPEVEDPPNAHLAARAEQGMTTGPLFRAVGKGRSKRPGASADQRYIPDFIAIDTDGVHWLIEGKADVRANDKDVLAKKEAAERWVRHVNDSGEVEAHWRYLFATETNIKHAAGSWAALQQVTGS